MTQQVNRVSSPEPIKISRLTGSAAPDERPPGSGLQIEWSDGTTTALSSEMLRRNCPCASCREERGEGSHSQPLSAQPRGGRLRVIAATGAEQTDLVQVWPVGNYAIGILWGDRHDSGIFSFGLLRELAGGLASSQEDA